MKILPMNTLSYKLSDNMDKNYSSRRYDTHTFVSTINSPINFKQQDAAKKILDNPELLSKFGSFVAGVAAAAYTMLVSYSSGTKEANPSVINDLLKLIGGSKDDEVTRLKKEIADLNKKLEQAQDNQNTITRLEKEIADLKQQLEHAENKNKTAAIPEIVSKEEPTIPEEKPTILDIVPVLPVQQDNTKTEPPIQAKQITPVKGTDKRQNTMKNGTILYSRKGRMSISAIELKNIALTLDIPKEYEEKFNQIWHLIVTKELNNDVAKALKDSLEDSIDNSQKYCEIIDEYCSNYLNEKSAIIATKEPIPNNQPPENKTPDIDSNKQLPSKVQQQWVMKHGTTLTRGENELLTSISELKDTALKLRVSKEEEEKFAQIWDLIIIMTSNPQTKEQDNRPLEMIYGLMAMNLSKELNNNINNPDEITKIINNFYNNNLDEIRAINDGKEAADKGNTTLTIGNQQPEAVPRVPKNKLLEKDEFQKLLSTLNLSTEEETKFSDFMLKLELSEEDQEKIAALWNHMITQGYARYEIKKLNNILEKFVNDTEMLSRAIRYYHTVTKSKDKLSDKEYDLLNAIIKLKLSEEDEQKITALWNLIITRGLTSQKEEEMRSNTYNKFMKLIERYDNIAKELSSRLDVNSSKPQKIANIIQRFYISYYDKIKAAANEKEQQPSAVTSKITTESTTKQTVHTEPQRWTMKNGTVLNKRRGGLSKTEEELKNILLSLELTKAYEQKLVALWNYIIVRGLTQQEQENIKTGYSKELKQLKDTYEALAESLKNDLEGKKDKPQRLTNTIDHYYNMYSDKINALNNQRETNSKTITSQETTAPDNTSQPTDTKQSSKTITMRHGTRIVVNKEPLADWEEAFVNVFDKLDIPEEYEIMLLAIWDMNIQGKFKNSDKDNYINNVKELTRLLNLYTNPNNKKPDSQRRMVGSFYDSITNYSRKSTANNLGFTQAQEKETTYNGGLLQNPKSNDYIGRIYKQVKQDVPKTMELIDPKKKVWLYKADETEETSLGINLTKFSNTFKITISNYLNNQNCEWAVKERMKPGTITVDDIKSELESRYTIYKNLSSQNIGNMQNICNAINLEPRFKDFTLPAAMMFIDKFCVIDNKNESDIEREINKKLDKLISIIQESFKRGVNVSYSENADSEIYARIIIDIPDNEELQNIFGQNITIFVSKQNNAHAIINVITSPK